jgi:hypothetical protein
LGGGGSYGLLELPKNPTSNNLQLTSNENLPV